MFKVNIRTIRDERIEVYIESESISAIAKEFATTQFTFIPKKQADFNSFTIFSHQIAKIEYTAVSFSPFEQVMTHELLSF